MWTFEIALGNEEERERKGLIVNSFTLRASTRERSTLLGKNVNKLLRQNAKTCLISAILKIH